MPSATEGMSESEDGADTSLSSAVYSVELQSTCKGIIDQKQPFTYMHSKTNNTGVKKKKKNYLEGSILI